MADEKSQSHTNAYVLNIKTKRERLIAKEIDGPVFWSPSGNTIIYALPTKGDGDRMTLCTYPTLQTRLLNNGDFMASTEGFSPNGKTVSLTFGPLEARGTTFVNVATGKSQYLKTELESYGKRDQAIYFGDWSPDSNHVILDLEMMDKEGQYWDWNALALGNLKTGTSKSIPNSKDLLDPQFYGLEHMLCIDRKHKRSLLLVDLQHPEKRTPLDQNVDTFAIK